jgi:UDP-N-acetylglucosamine:LPS N-acetylglucosamine transferase
LACKVLTDAGETILPESQFSADYNQALGQVLTRFGLSLTKYIAATRAAFAHNVEVFREVVTRYNFDLVIGDESYELTRAMAAKTVHLECRMVEIEDLVGFEAMTRNPLVKLGIYMTNRRAATRPALLSPRVRHFFVGELEDVLDKRFGFGLPNRRGIAREYYQFLGYVIRFDPAEYADKAKMKAKLGYGPGPLLICATGGLCAGKELLELCGKAYSILKTDIPDLHMVAVCGELFGKKPPELPAGVELHSYISDLYEHYAACDMAVVVGGGTTTVELTALRRPFVFFPLENQFDQQLYIADRLARQGAGIKMRFYETTPQSLTDVIRKNIGKEATWPPIRTDGARKAATLINELLSGTA